MKRWFWSVKDMPKIGFSTTRRHRASLAFKEPSARLSLKYWMSSAVIRATGTR